MSVLFKGGTVVNASGRYLADVFADGDKIKAIGTDLDNPADEIVDAKDKYILPGAIDPIEPPGQPAGRTTPGS